MSYIPVVCPECGRTVRLDVARDGARTVGLHTRRGHACTGVGRDVCARCPSTDVRTCEPAYCGPCYVAVCSED